MVSLKIIQSMCSSVNLSVSQAEKHRIPVSRFMSVVNCLRNSQPSVRLSFRHWIRQFAFRLSNCLETFSFFISLKAIHLASYLIHPITWSTIWFRIHQSEIEIRHDNRIVCQDTICSASIQHISRIEIKWRGMKKFISKCYNLTLRSYQLWLAASQLYLLFVRQSGK